MQFAQIRADATSIISRETLALLDQIVRKKLLLLVKKCVEKLLWACNLLKRVKNFIVLVNYLHKLGASSGRNITHYHDRSK